jgi:RND family efflux transporter MFP subunit
VAETKPTDEARGRRATPTPSEGDRAVWRRFAEAATVDDFYRGWLGIQCRLIRGVATAVVFGLDPGRDQVGPALAVWGKGSRPARLLRALAQRAVAQRRRVVVQHHVDAGRVVAVAFPVQARGRTVAAVALALRARPEAAVEGALRQLEWGSGWLEALALRQTAAEPSAVANATDDRRSAAAERLQTALDVVASAQGHDRFADAATAFVTELGTRLGCDRVSIGFVRRGRARVDAVSHTARVGSRTNLVRAIGAAMDEAIDQDAVVACPAQPDAARVTRAHEALARQTSAGAICTVPFASGRRIVGALTLERPAGHPLDADTIALAEAVAGLAGPGLDILRREDRWLAAKAVDSVRWSVGALLGPGHVALKLGALATLITAVVLSVVTAEYRVTARAVMEAGIQRAAVAPFGGYVREAPVRAGDVVRAGQVLAVLDDREMRLERARLQSQRAQLERQRALALAQGNAAQLGIARAQIDQTTARIDLIDAQLGRTRVVSDVDGVVVTGDLRESLGAPVDKGQVLFEVAPLDAYRLRVEVDERDIDDVAVGQSGQLVLASAPFEPVPFTVDKIVPVATARDGRNFFRVEARLPHAFDRLRPGMEGVAKIAVDRRLAVSIWTRSVLDWARLTAWTWWP